MLLRKTESRPKPHSLLPNHNRLKKINDPQRKDKLFQVGKDQPSPVGMRITRREARGRRRRALNMWTIILVRTWCLSSGLRQSTIWRSTVRLGHFNGGNRWKRRQVQGINSTSSLLRNRYRMQWSDSSKANTTTEWWCCRQLTLRLRSSTWLTSGRSTRGTKWNAFLTSTDLYLFLSGTRPIYLGMTKGAGVTGIEYSSFLIILSVWWWVLWIYLNYAKISYIQGCTLRFHHKAD